MNFRYPLILASSSPRRRFLLSEAGFRFTVSSPDIDESFPAEMPPEDVPVMLAEKKAAVLAVTSEVVVSSDTVVILNHEILNKPADRDDAIRMLTALSGKTHRVVTAVCIRTAAAAETFRDITRVTFRTLTRKEITDYIDLYNPLDKAGSYGAQDCLPEGMNPCSADEKLFLNRIRRDDLLSKTIRSGNRVVIIDKIEGSYFTVMGLPIQLLYDRLIKLLEPIP